MIMNLVFVTDTSSSNREQKRVTLASSRGASTSSKTQKGAGFKRYIANSKDVAVNVFSPPES